MGRTKQTANKTYKGKCPECGKKDCSCKGGCSAKTKEGRDKMKAKGKPVGQP